MSRLPVPRNVFEQHIILLGKTRSGKSSAMRDMVEDLLDHGEPVCIVDPKGDWWGLRSSADGKEPSGYELVIFGGPKKDVPLNARSGAAVAELLATGNRSALIDLGGWMPGDRTQFWIDFASSYFRFHQGHHFLVIDEVHNFCPKGKVMDVNAGKMLHWSNRLASEGLGKGITLIAASQRPQKVHNDFLTSCETLIAKKVIHKADRDAIKDWIDACGDMEKGKEVLNTIAGLERSEAWAYSPESDFGPKRVTFPMFRTYDSFKPQPRGSEAKLKGWTEVNLADVTKKMEAAIKEAEANDPGRLRARISELQRQLSAKPGAPKSVADPHVATELQRYKSHANDLKQYADNLTHRLVRIYRAVSDCSSLVTSVPSPPSLAAAKKGDAVPIETRNLDAVRERVPRSGNSSELPDGEKVVLQAIARYQNGVTRSQLSGLTDYRRSTRDAYIARLKPKGFIAERGDRIVATPEGITALGSDYEQLPMSGEDLQAYWLQPGRLPDGEKKILEILIAAGGSPVERESLDEQTGYSRSTRDAYLSRLGTKEVVEADGRGAVKASSNLF